MLWFFSHICVSEALSLCLLKEDELKTSLAAASLYLCPGLVSAY